MDRGQGRRRRPSHVPRQRWQPFRVWNTEKGIPSGVQALALQMAGAGLLLHLSNVRLVLVADKAGHFG